MSRQEITDLVTKLSYLETSKLITSKGLPFAVSRLMIALNMISINWALTRLGEDAVSAGPFITSLQYLMMGTFRGALLGSGILYGEHNGKKAFSELGKINRQALRLGIYSSISAMALLNTLPIILSKAGLTNSEITSYVESYFNYFSIAVLPTLLGVVDQQIAVATKHANVPLVFGFAYAGLSSALGIPMGLGYFGELLSGVKGFSIGTSIASWLSFAELRTHYFFGKDYKKYELFKKSTNSTFHYFRELFSIGLKLGAQVTTEWANLAAISIIFSKFGNNSLNIIQPSIQCLTSWGLVTLGMAQSQGTLISNELGSMQKAIAQNNPELARIHHHNLKRIGNTGLAVDGAISAVVCALLYTFSEEISEFFLPEDSSSSTLKDASLLLNVNTLGILIDSIRNLLMGNLRGFKDVNFSMYVSFIFMSVVGLSLGSGLLFDESSDPIDTFFWIRNAMILLPALLMGMRWHQFSNYDPEKQVEIFENNKKADRKGCATSCFFKSQEETEEITPLLSSVQVTQDENATAHSEEKDSATRLNLN